MGVSLAVLATHGRSSGDRSGLTSPVPNADTSSATSGAERLTAPTGSPSSHPPISPSPSATPTPSKQTQEASAETTRAAPPARTRFQVFDNTFYTNVDLTRYGAVRSNIVYEHSVAELTGQSQDFRGGTRPGVELALPPQAAYEQLVRRLSVHPGPVVLDFETLYLKGAADVVQRRFGKLRTLLAWAHRAVPGKAIGYYGLLGNTAPQYLHLARELAKDEDAFFPSLYVFTNDRTQWRALLARRVAEAKSIDPDKPIYAYLWPEFHDNSNLAGTYVSADYWSFQLAESRTQISGVVVWSKQKPNAEPGWVNATRTFLTDSHP